MAGDFIYPTNYYQPYPQVWTPLPYYAPQQNYCTRCACYFSNPGSCNCFARPYTYPVIAPTPTSSITWGGSIGSADSITVYGNDTGQLSSGTVTLGGGVTTSATYFTTDGTWTYFNASDGTWTNDVSDSTDAEDA